MSNLRIHLDRAKAEHEEARYPGDLAAELLAMSPDELKPIPYEPSGKPLTANRWFWAVGTSSAVAASLITAFILTSRTPDLSITNLPPGMGNPTMNTGIVATPAGSERNMSRPPQRNQTSPNFVPGPAIELTNGSTRPAGKAGQVPGASSPQPRLRDGTYTPPK